MADGQSPPLSDVLSLPRPNSSPRGNSLRLSMSRESAISQSTSPNQLCALKQKPGVLLAKIFHKIYYPNPNCRPYSSPHQVHKHRMLWYIEKGTLREVGKIDA